MNNVLGFCFQCWRIAVGQYLVFSSGSVNSQVDVLTGGHPCLKLLLFARSL